MAEDSSDEYYAKREAAQKRAGARGWGDGNRIYRKASCPTSSTHFALSLEFLQRSGRKENPPKPLPGAVEVCRLLLSYFPLIHIILNMKVNVVRESTTAEPTRDSDASTESPST